MSTELEVRRETMRWVAGRLRALRDLPPHEWDRSTLLELAQALDDSNPRLYRFLRITTQRKEVRT